MRAALQHSVNMLERYHRVRRRSVSLCAPVTAEDAQVQSMPEASPAKWHLAHTTWFFEKFVLGGSSRDYLFNSYYEAAGARVERARRGLMTRPSLAEVLAYREEIDAKIGASADPFLLELGLAHEEQHQELILTDLKHALGTQPLQPPYRSDVATVLRADVEPLGWNAHGGGTIEIGAVGGFSFDCERPRHRRLVDPYWLADRPVCNAEVIAFIAEGGYRDPRLWLAEGFAVGLRAPLYWELRDGVWFHYTLGGTRVVVPAEAACHLSYYEADAIARWMGARLPAEEEWEHAAAQEPVDGHFADDDRLHPTAGGSLFGDVWVWTQSAYAPYPGYRPLAGAPPHHRSERVGVFTDALGEYNGKFMVGQLVLRGGSCLTPRGHVRASYRNFFPPGARWQMTGVRLAKDGT